jgi:hypothetical protein
VNVAKGIYVHVILDLGTLIFVMWPASNMTFSLTNIFAQIDEDYERRF